MSFVIYDEGLRAPSTSLSVRYSDGTFQQLDLQQWCGTVTRADHSLLARVAGCALDIGCGPGRFTAALASRGSHVLGIDPSAAAIDLTRARGGPAFLCSVFGTVPDSGHWDTAILADGNIGIGGDPERLLRRVGVLVQGGGTILVEMTNADRPRGRVRARLEDGHGRVGDWFAWEEPSRLQLAGYAAAAGLRWLESWMSRDDDGRCREFVKLTVLS